MFLVIQNKRVEVGGGGSRLGKESTGGIHNSGGEGGKPSSDPFYHFSYSNSPH